MKFYVAGKTNDWHLVRAVQQELRAKGHEITYDWTETVEDVGPNACTTGQVTDEFRRECAENDMDGVAQADIVVIVHGKGMAGTWIEMGMALAMGKRVWSVYEPERNSVFLELPLVTKLADGHAFQNKLLALPEYR